MSDCKITNLHAWPNMAAYRDQRCFGCGIFRHEYEGKKQMEALNKAISNARRPDLKIILPFPPSVNHLFAQNKTNARLRFRTKAYKAWIEKCVAILEKPEAAIVTCTISYKIFFPDNRIRDGQNYMKAPLDLLVTEGIIFADDRRHVKGEQWIDGGVDKLNPRVEIIIKEIK